MQIFGTILWILFVTVIIIILAVLAFGPVVLDELDRHRKRNG